GIVHRKISSSTEYRVTLAATRYSRTWRDNTRLAHHHQPVAPLHHQHHGCVSNLINWLWQL
ncbi:hypothetical protein JI435_401520, partial [Parastagonospora nodorum SN15]